MASYRLDKVREMLLRELTDIVPRLRDPRIGFVTIMDVEVTRDMRRATMYISVVGDDDAKQEATEALEKALGYIRREIAKRITLRHVPEFAVVYDDTSERAARVTSLLERVALECPPAPLEEAETGTTE
ncbi:MAG: 30S ribosome-binding factor RbfA [Gemmatimonadetes bacterium]|jgi:ribosome-binding factor A|nr:30S ribosome-binding factor RbfA [Gemmatimonadota bacterium]MBT4612423.1 30S ribosome-binding factor RbfA [Gemmatimonadota bacterium]MBT5059941.1 30S ribosome-binding factor RbfA [Gemmatimonadota bacterium]MBT5141952.1 30S ribosome-binding factor RbfA [Gemmatimonadota bacterium]MBT5589758.1 30S ribosome-binding factor RbfA [Gemmatimonadota bacterium]